MSYRIGSFNVHNMGRNATEEKIKKIADIVRKENFDIVALQEIFCLKDGIISSNDIAFPLSDILRNLGHNYKAYFEEPPQSTRPAKEGYAFIWNTNSFHLPKAKIFDERTNGTIQRTFYPRIFNQYRLDKNAGQINLIRNPLYARFVPNNQPMMEFRIINTHIRFSKNPDEDSDSTDKVPIGAAEMRRNEFRVISKNIYPKICDKIYGTQEAGNCGSFYTIIIGDYNLNLRRNWTNPPFIEDAVFLPNNHILMVGNESLTTIKRVTEENEQEFYKEQKYNNNFDHITYDRERFSKENGISINIEKVDAVRKYNNNDFVDYRKNISDHIPIKMEFDNRNR